jgi:protein ImuB
VQVDGRVHLNAAPARLITDRAMPVAGWAGPWPTEEQWWETPRRRAWLQVVPVGGDPVLLVAEGGAWHLAAVYQ